MWSVWSIWGSFLQISKLCSNNVINLNMLALKNAHVIEGEAQKSRLRVSFYLFSITIFCLLKHQIKNAKFLLGKFIFTRSFWLTLFEWKPMESKVCYFFHATTNRKILTWIFQLDCSKIIVLQKGIWQFQTKPFWSALITSFWPNFWWFL